jgi:hypothetical protein
MYATLISPFPVKFALGKSAENSDGEMEALVPTLNKDSARERSAEDRIVAMEL